MPGPSEDPSPPSDTNGGRVLTRRRLLWGLGALAPAVALAGAWVVRATNQERPLTEPPSPLHVDLTEMAARYCASGDYTKALRYITLALDKSPQHAPAFLVLACIAIEAGQFDEARQALARLRSLAPSAAEVALLSELTEHRQRDTASSWMQAFFAAWAKLDRPDFQKSLLLPSTLVIRLLPNATDYAEAWRREDVSAEARFLAALMSDDLMQEQTGWMTQQIPSIQSPALLVALFSRTHRPESSSTVRQQLGPVLRQRLKGIIAPPFDFIQPRLVLLLMGSAPESPLTPQELKGLEELSLLPSWRDISRLQTFLAVRDLLQQLALPRASKLALSISEWSLGVRAADLLLERLVPTWGHLSTDDQRWVGRMLWLIGSRLSEQDSLRECRTGAFVQRQGAEILLHGPSLGDAVARQKAIDDTVQLAQRSTLERWPFHTLENEVCLARARHEIELLNVLSGKQLPP